MKWLVYYQDRCLFAITKTIFARTALFDLYISTKIGPESSEFK